MNRRLAGLLFMPVVAFVAEPRMANLISDKDMLESMGLTSRWTGITAVPWPARDGSE